MGSKTYLYYLTQEPTSSGTASPHTYAGYGLNDTLTNLLYDASGNQNQTYRMGDTVRVNEVYAAPNPSPTEVIFMAEHVYTSSNNLEDPTTKLKDRGSPTSGTTKAPIYTPEGKATRSYLDGHAASRTAEDMNWIATSPTTGHWASIWTSTNTRIKPWFSLN